jgi:hypothetical protein
MLTGGASAFYAPRLVGGERNGIAITGYQDEESPGRQLLALAEAETREVSVAGRTLEVKCAVEKYALSAHADCNEIAGLIEAINPLHCAARETSLVDCQYQDGGNCEMDKLTRYPNPIKSLLAKFVELDNKHSNSGVDHVLVADDERGHYFWHNVGWWRRERLSAPTVYVRLMDGRFWIEDDMTEVGIANELMEAGVPKEDIVLAFQHPLERQYTEFAAA